MPRFAAFGVMLDFCHTSNVILTFSILSYQDGPKYAVKTMLWVRSIGVMEQKCHTSNVILTFSILRYQDGPTYVIKTMLFGGFHRCDAHFLSHVQRHINFFDFKI